MAPEMYYYEILSVVVQIAKKYIEIKAQCQKNCFENFDFTFSFELVKLVKSNVDRL